MTSERYAHLRGAPLTSVDKELLAFMAEGLSNRQIAAMTGRPLETIKHRTTRLYARLGVSCRAHAVAWLYEREDVGVTATEDDNKQLRATIAGLRAKVAELQDKLINADTARSTAESAYELAERELAELKKLLTTTDLPAAWLDSTQGRL